MEKKLKEAKKIYESIQIPEELDEMVNKTINNANKKSPSKLKIKKGFFTATAAAVMICGALTIGLNTNEAFANSASEVPIIGNIARLLTFSEFEFQSEVIVADIRIPEVNLNDKALAKKINLQIYREMKTCLSESETRALEYKEAYLATGGTEEDFIPIDVKMDYELKSIDEKILSFVLYHYESLAAAYSETQYYNINLENDEILKLEDIYGNEYMSIVNSSIEEQIELENSKSENNVYFEFDGIDENQKFYINEKGETVIVFDKYAIAPGSMGMPEFIIE
ncbi:protein of unknown function [Dethiosulfatibacter aminovorans DSM 17477]|uniref:Uncharacterized protein n=1 Tax=Dethiosulfatibacter aminovorans DSM 17477 TaxID=1121476 RepID=A0A1M6B4G3_9FIRM|nr:DUF3298 and DUF4163 domain-containing protein [Dethiosulfatibacter aminovorans]SHI43644.1 protein of unknown function [Dethiosulfatibacter aminovorans DSM 17477]